MGELGFHSRATAFWLCDLGLFLFFSEPSFMGCKVGSYGSTWLWKFLQELNRTRCIMHIVGVQLNGSFFLALACFVEAESELSDTLGLIPGLRFLHQRRKLLGHSSRLNYSSSTVWLQVPSS